MPSSPETERGWIPCLSRRSESRVASTSSTTHMATRARPSQAKADVGRRDDGEGETVTIRW
jgi:hypothetical protein